MTEALRISGALVGERALVTGGARRVGRSIVRSLAGAGAEVVVHFHTSSAEATALVEDLRHQGVEAFAIQAALSDPKEAEALVGQAAKVAGGPLTVLVNNASVFPLGGLFDLDLESLEETVRINAWSPLFLIRSFAKQGVEGTVVNLLDSRVSAVDPHHVAYELSKALLQRITHLAALELAPRIRVNSVALGAILPPEGRGAPSLDPRKSEIPLRRTGSLDDVTGAVLFLITQRFITGETLFVDGGQHIRRWPS